MRKTTQATEIIQETENRNKNKRKRVKRTSHNCLWTGEKRKKIKFKEKRRMHQSAHTQ
jgi:hypothetical protein